MNRLLMLILVVVAPWLTARGNEPARWFVSPGIKLAYAFGESPGFLFGWEVSVFTWTNWDPNGPQEGCIGFVVDWDYCGSISKLHVGFEASQRLVGASLGPTIITQNDSKLWGFTATVYSWFGVLPYYSYTYVRGMSDVHEIGGYLKIPILVSGPRISFKMGGVTWDAPIRDH